MAVDHKPFVGNSKVFNKHNYLQQKRNVICISSYNKSMWSMPNIVFYIEIDYLSIDESKLLGSNKDKAKTKGALCPWK